MSSASLLHRDIGDVLAFTEIPHFVLVFNCCTQRGTACEILQSRPGSVHYQVAFKQVILLGSSMEKCFHSSLKSNNRLVTEVYGRCKHYNRTLEKISIYIKTTSSRFMKFFFKVAFPFPTHDHSILQ